MLHHTPLTFDQVQQFLSGVRGSTFAGLDTLTIPQMVKKIPGSKEPNPHYGKVQKLTTNAVVQMFASSKSAYEAMVKRRLEQEGKDADAFELSPPKWGQRIGDTMFFQHTPAGEDQVQYYMQTFFQHPGTTTYYLDGQPIDKDAIIGLRESSENEESQGGLERKVIIRTFKIPSIIAIRHHGTTLNIPQS